MADSKFMLTVERVDGTKVYLRPGGHAERDLKTLISAKLTSKGVGILRTTNHVIADWEAAFMEAVQELKSDIEPA